MIIHGMLHLSGLDDHCEEDIAEMRAAENSALGILENFIGKK